MPRTLEEYHHHWQMRGVRGFPGEERITPTSCVLRGSMLGSAPGMSDAFYVFDDFGDALGFCHYYALEDEINNYEGDKTKEELEAFRKEAELYFDALLERYVREGYQSEMGRLLEQGMDTYFYLYQLGVYVLPNDLPDLLDSIGNPLVSEEDEEEGEAEKKEQPLIDLNNPEHCAAIWQRLDELIL